jgi:putative resolvase
MCSTHGCRVSGKSKMTTWLGKPSDSRRRPPSEAVLTEQSSSLNERRKGMKQLLSLIGEQAVDMVLIEYPDRLVRFGWKDMRLKVLDPPKQQEPTQELIQDMLTIVTVFAGRLYGHRAKGMRKRMETVLQKCEQEEQANGTGKPHHEAAP